MKPFAFTLLVAGIATSVWPETPLVPVMNEPLAGGQTVSVAVGHALNIAETSGRNVRVHAVYRASRSGGAAERQYDLAPHAQRLIEFSADVGPVEATISVSGEGRVTVWAQAAAAFGAIQDIVAAPFKAAPFYEKATGLIYMRDRWYDPRTGTFLTPDPEGYRDSSNLYSYCAGDPINCTDPTGDAASASRSGVIIGIRPDGTRYRIEKGADIVKALRVLESDPDLETAADQEDIMLRAGMAIPYSSAARPGETLIGSRRPNYRAYTHLPNGDDWLKNAIVATSGLPPQNRQQELVQGGVQLAGTAMLRAIEAQAGSARADVMTNYKGVGPVTVSHAEAEGWMLPHRNRLDANGPHDVYAIVDAKTRQVYHFGETGRGWQTRGREWQRRLKQQYGLDTEVVALRTNVPGKAAAKEWETNYITTYEKAFGRRPFYIDEEGAVIPIQKTRH
jgi:RHS repeat-associated protein